jgi:hypothetical protein
MKPDGAICDNRKWPDLEVSPFGGVPTLSRDGRAWFGLGAQRPYLGDQTDLFHVLERAGAQWLQCDATCSEDIYHPELRFWHGPGHFDGRVMDAYFRKVLGTREDTLLLLRVYCGAPEWWLDAHPEEWQHYPDGSQARLMQNAGVRRVPSIASRVWRREICEAMRAFVQWLMESGWSKRVGGFLVSYGITWEWAILGTDGYPDVSPTAQSAFREFLSKKYGNSEAISVAWGRSVAPGEAVIPSLERQTRTGGPEGLRQLPDEQDVIDHQQFLSEENADLLLALCRTLRETAGTGPLIGAFYGYTLTAREQTPFTGLYGAGGFLGGHHAFGRVLRSPDVDFFASPYAYANRRLGDGMLFEHGPLGSCHRHGKLWIDENDNYTFLSLISSDSRLAALDVGRADSLEETIAMLRWAFGLALVRGKHLWLTELSGWLTPYYANFDHPEILAEIKRLAQIAESVQDLDRAGSAEIALVLDEHSVAHYTLDHKGFERGVYRSMPQFLRMGCAVEVLLLEDLLEAASAPWRLVVPLGICAPDSLRHLQAWAAKHPGRLLASPDSALLYPAPAAVREAAEQAGVRLPGPMGACVWETSRLLFSLGAPELRLPPGRRGRELFHEVPVVVDPDGKLGLPEDALSPALILWDENL